MTSESIATYLHRLNQALRGYTFMSGRVTDEIREHLNDAIEAGVRRGLSAEAATANALARFGDPAQIADEFQHVYRWEHTVWYLAKFALSVLASIAAALAVQVLINVRIALKTEVVRIAPGFSRATLISVATVVGIAAAWEIARRHFDTRRTVVAILAYGGICATVQWLVAWGWTVFAPATGLVILGYLCARFEPRPRRLLSLFGVFAVSLYAAHMGVRGDFGAKEALTTSGALLMVWVSTVAILARFDHAFLDTVNS
jgi:hypothetical protein